ncbi:MAG: zinc-ribbon domain-containing protein, partial [Actinobacteria bacterium]
MTHCPACGSDMETGAKVCPECGADVMGVTASFPPVGGEGD